MKRLLPTVFFAMLQPAAVTVAAPPPPPPGAPVIPTAVLETISAEQARLELARVLSYAKRYDEALVEYRTVLAARPADTALRAEYGQVLGWAGRNAEAVTVLSAVPAADLPPETAVLLADLILADKKFADAAVLYRRSLAAKPGDALTRFKLARVLSWEKHYDEALVEYRTLLTATPADMQVRRHYAQTLGWAGRLEDAAAEWRRTLPAEATP